MNVRTRKPMQRYEFSFGFATYLAKFLWITLENRTKMAIDNENFVKSMEESSALAENKIDWRQYRHDPTNRDIAVPDWLVDVGGRNYFPRKEIVPITGRGGNGKSQFVVQILGAVMSGERVLGITPLRKSRQILYVDTEQSEYDVAFRLNMMFRAMDKPEFSEFPINVEYLRLRPEPENGKRMKITMEALSDLRPDVIFIDGVTDLITDIEDKNEGVKQVNDFLKIVDDFGANLFPVIHQNEGGDSTKLRESVGSEYMRKSRQIIGVTVRNGTFEAKALKGIPFSYNWRITPFGNLTTNLSVEEQVCENEKKQIAQVFMKVVNARGKNIFDSKKQIYHYIGAQTATTSDKKNADMLERAVALGIVNMGYDGHKYKLWVNGNETDGVSDTMACG